MPTRQIAKNVLIRNCYELLRIIQEQWKKTDNIIAEFSGSSDRKYADVSVRMFYGQICVGDIRIATRVLPFFPDFYQQMKTAVDLCIRMWPNVSARS